MFLISFYSPSVGVGRTLAIVHVGWLLNDQKKNVLLCDLDVEAPGLTQQLFMKEPEPEKGFVDLVVDYLDSARFPEVESYIERREGSFDVLPAGAVGDAQYGAKLARINWPELFGSPQGEALVADLRRQFAELGYDYVLVDSKTGSSDVGGLCALQRPDGVCLVLGLDDQSIAGTRKALDLIRNHNRENRGHPVFAALLVSLCSPLSDEVLSKRMEVAQAGLECHAKRFTTIAHDGELASQGPIVFAYEQAKQSPAAHDYRNLCKRLRRMDRDDRLAMERELDECLSQFASGCPRPEMTSNEGRGEESDRERLLARSLALVRSLLELGPLTRTLVFRALDVGRQLDAVDQTTQLIRGQAEAWTVETTPHDAKPWVDAGVALGSLGEATGDTELHRAACEKCAKAVETEPDDAGAWGYWGYALGQLGDMTQDAEARTDLIRQACEKFARAVEARPDFHQAWANWGLALGRLADATDGVAAKASLLREACQKYWSGADAKADASSVRSGWGMALGKLADVTEDAEARTFLMRRACERSAEAVETGPDEAGAWSKWGYALGRLAHVTQDAEARTDLLRQACEKLARAVDTKPDCHDAWGNWGWALRRMARMTQDAEAKASLLRQACDKYAKAAEIRPDDNRAWHHWGAVLLEIYATTGESHLLGEAREKCHKMEEIEPGAAAYALARVESLDGNVEEGLRWLAQAFKHRHDMAAFAINDRNLARLRQEVRFWVIVGRPQPNDGDG